MVQLSQVKCTVDEQMVRHYKGGEAAESDSRYKKALEKNLDSCSMYVIQFLGYLSRTHTEKKQKRLCEVQNKKCDHT